MKRIEGSNFDNTKNFIVELKGDNQKASGVRITKSRSNLDIVLWYFAQMYGLFFNGTVSNQPFAQHNTFLLVFFPVKSECRNQFEMNVALVVVVVCEQSPLVGIQEIDKILKDSVG